MIADFRTASWRAVSGLWLAAIGSGFTQEKPALYEVAQIEAIRAAEGERVTVRGIVERTGKSQGSGMNFLNFPGGEFTAVVFAKSLKNFPAGEPAEVYKGELVEVTGTIGFYRDKPQIIVEVPDQIVVLDPATGKPPPAEPVEPVAGPDPPEQQDPIEPEPEPVAPKPGKVDPRLYFDDP